MCNLAPAITTHSASPEQTSDETFAERMIATLNAGATSLMLSLSHRTGLFDCMAELAPVTSSEMPAPPHRLGRMGLAAARTLDPAAAAHRHVRWPVL